MKRTILVMASAGFAVVLALSVPRHVAADDHRRGRQCGEHTLRGDYGLVGTGIRGIGPGATEPFVTVSMVTYDGNGAFTAEGVSHGQTTGVRGGPVLGTYYVNPDCTGGQSPTFQGSRHWKTSSSLLTTARR